MDTIKYPHPYLAVCLLDECNKACKHCYRTAIGSEHGFKLNKQEAIATVDDAASLATACIFAGGEPTIWQEDDMDFLSLVMKAAKQNGRTAFLSNGYIFENKDYAHEFMSRYMAECAQPLQMTFSVDFIHANYDAGQERIPFLDNLIAARAACSAREVVLLYLLSHWTNNERMNIPVHVFQRYAEQGVGYHIDDFMMWGRGAGLADLACYVEVGSRDKTSLGPYCQILKEKMIAAGKIADDREFEELPNRKLLKRLSVCGHTPNFFISWGTRYYYCIPHMGHDWFNVAEIGRLSLDAMESFYAAQPVIREIQNLSILGVLDKYRRLIPEHLLEEIHVMRENIRFAGCSVCLKLHEAGVLEGINQKILSESGYRRRT